MQKIVLALAGAAAMLSTSAFAADLRMATKAPPMAVYVSPWDIAFGGSLATEYNFRGITQSNHGAAVAAYFEPRYNISSNFQLYAGIAGLSVSFPAPLTQATAEIDLYAGIRPTFGPLAFDFGVTYYYYPNEILPVGGFQTDFWEGYAKAAWTVNDIITVGGNVFYAGSWLGTGASGTYASGTLKLTAPGTMFPTIGAYASGEFGRYWLGMTTSLAAGTNFDIPDYNYWNVGVGLTYKVFTLDLRYHDTDASGPNCLLITGFATPVGGTTSNWCSAAYVAKLSFDLTLGALK